MSDAINPDHYKRLPAEAIDIIEAAIEGAPTNREAYLQGQALKYLLRANHKNGREDMLKAQWYLSRLVDSFMVPADFLDGLDDKKTADLKSLKDYPFGEPDSVIKENLNTEINKPVKPTLNSDTIPDGYRKLKDAWIEPRKLDDLRWSVSEKRYVAMEMAVIHDANRDNWAACRKIETTEPPDGWRWLEVGEVIRKFDKDVYPDGIIQMVRSSVIGSVYHTPANLDPRVIRRNKFKVGEKVVWIKDNTVWTVEAIKNAGTDFPYEISSENLGYVLTSSKMLAPYIEVTE